MSTHPTETCEGCGQEINPWLDHYCKGREAEAWADKQAQYWISTAGREMKNRAEGGR